MRGDLKNEMIRRLDAMAEQALLGGWPRGYEPGKGMPGTLTIDSIRGGDRSSAPPCGCRVIHTCGFICC